MRERRTLEAELQALGLSPPRSSATLQSSLEVIQSSRTKAFTRETTREFDTGLPRISNPKPTLSSIKVADLIEALESYIKQHRSNDIAGTVQRGVKRAGASLVLVGEHHATVEEATEASKLLVDGRNFYGYEGFLNANPKSDPQHPLERRNIGRADLHAFVKTGNVNALSNLEPSQIELLIDLRRKKLAILAIGSRQPGKIKSEKINPAQLANIRDPQLAKHFRDEIHSRGFTSRTPGVIQLGVVHAAAVPILNAWRLNGRRILDKQRATTRQRLQPFGFKAISICVVTNAEGSSRRHDQSRIFTKRGDGAPILLMPDRETESFIVPLRETGTPFRALTTPFIEDDAHPSPNSFAEAFEFAIFVDLWK